MHTTQATNKQTNYKKKLILFMVSNAIWINIWSFTMITTTFQATNDFNFGDNHAGCYCTLPACEVDNGKNIVKYSTYYMTDCQILIYCLLLKLVTINHCLLQTDEKRIDKGYLNQFKGPVRPERITKCVVKSLRRESSFCQ